ncbi:Laminin EGF domain [Popillia japonica]|uniref:Laminin EGF domain n=1 Tax=Popillia japonica TaxID=7064 RepID=A0AAW1LFM5_POPJA
MPRGVYLSEDMRKKIIQLNDKGIRQLDIAARLKINKSHPECECTHHTCGPNCDRCCPLYNQRTWGPGSPAEARQCLPCNCHGHAKSCHYDEDIDRAGLSMDVNGNYQGGGVCDNCTSHTVGINCERCIRGYYRPKGVSPSDQTPCLRCDCNPLGSTGSCTVDEDAVVCDCRPGYAGPRCDSCMSGFRGFPDCEPCPCDSRGTADVSDCEGQCMCKVNAEGAFCERCKSGYFSLRESNPDGCFPCYCSGVTNLCESAILVQQTIKTEENWHVCDVSVSSSEKVYPDEQGILSIANYEAAAGGPYYWLAPSPYLGNKLIVYGSVFTFRLIWIVMRGDTSGKPTKGPNIILVGRNGKKIAYGNDLFSSTNVTFRIPFTERDWYYFDANSDKDDVTAITRSDFLSILIDVKHILLRAKFHADQIDVALEEASFIIGEGMSAVEKCSCPSGYVGLSCESCDYGYVRIMANSSNGEGQSFCGKCDCNGHSKTCDPDTGQCLCEHNTTGENCDRCLPGFYGNPMIGMPGDCKQCACPLLTEENNFSPSCQLDLFKLTSENEEQGYVCTQCPRGYTGDHCEICDDGYYGAPTIPGQKCQQCNCGGNPCDRKTGQCLACKGNTEGWRCERCKPGYFGNPGTGSCQACLCDPIGSVSEECNNVTGQCALSEECNNVTGQCACKDKFVGRTCDGCIQGYGNKTADCVRCDCNEIGSKSSICDPKTGLCDCRPGVEGFHCDACQHLHYGFSEIGCQRECRAQADRSGDCIRCGESGHKGKECTNRNRCTTCNVDGHRADQIKCPKFKKKIQKDDRDSKKTEDALYRSKDAEK